jgi:hypothetical protein
VLYPFGHGLSYTTFTLDWSPTPPEVAGGALLAGDDGFDTELLGGNDTVTGVVFGDESSAVTYTVKVTNTGKIAGDEVVLAYYRPDKASLQGTLGADTPVVLKQLFAFERIHLGAGESKSLSFTVNASTLALADMDGHTAIHPGKFGIVFSRGHGKDIEAPLEVQMAEPIRTSEFRQWW